MNFTYCPKCHRYGVIHGERKGWRCMLCGSGEDSRPVVLPTIPEPKPPQGEPPVTTIVKKTHPRTPLLDTVRAPENPLEQSLFCVILSHMINLKNWMDADYFTGVRKEHVKLFIQKMEQLAPDTMFEWCQDLDKQIQQIGATARAACPDFPWTEKPDLFEYVYALESALKGTQAAADDRCNDLKRLLAATERFRLHRRLRAQKYAIHSPGETEELDDMITDVNGLSSAQEIQIQHLNALCDMAEEIESTLFTEPTFDEAVELLKKFKGDSRHPDLNRSVESFLLRAERRVKLTQTKEKP